MIAIEAMQIFEFRIQELALRLFLKIQTFKKILKLYNKITLHLNSQPFQNHEILLILNLQNIIKNTII